jgi:hypothetical protein
VEDGEETGNKRARMAELEAKIGMYIGLLLPVKRVVGADTMVAGFERALKERDERPLGERPEQRDSDCIDPATGLPMFSSLPKDVAWPSELPVYGVTGRGVENASFGDDENGMELVWPKYVKKIWSQ